MDFGKQVYTVCNTYMHISKHSIINHVTNMCIIWTTHLLAMGPGVDGLYTQTLIRVGIFFFLLDVDRHSGFFLYLICVHQYPSNQFKPV